VLPVVVVLVVAIGAGSAGLILLRRSDDGPASAVRSYLADVQATQYDAAYGRLCGSVRGGRSAAQFGVIMRAFDGIRGNVAAFAVRDVQTRHPTAGVLRGRQGGRQLLPAHPGRPVHRRHVWLRRHGPGIWALRSPARFGWFRWRLGRWPR
jgi:hypothetical protein